MDRCFDEIKLDELLQGIKTDALLERPANLIAFFLEYLYRISPETVLGSIERLADVQILPLMNRLGHSQTRRSLFVESRQFTRSAGYSCSPARLDDPGDVELPCQCPEEVSRDTNQVVDGKDESHSVFSQLEGNGSHHDAAEHNDLFVSDTEGSNQLTNTASTAASTAVEGAKEDEAGYRGHTSRSFKSQSGLFEVVMQAASMSTSNNGGSQQSHPPKSSPALFALTESGTSLEGISFVASREVNQRQPIRQRSVHDAAGAAPRLNSPPAEDLTASQRESPKAEIERCRDAHVVKEISEGLSGLPTVTCKCLQTCLIRRTKSPIDTAIYLSKKFRDKIKADRERASIRDVFGISIISKALHALLQVTKLRFGGSSDMVVVVASACIIRIFLALNLCEVACIKQSDDVDRKTLEDLFNVTWDRLKLALASPLITVQQFSWLLFSQDTQMSEIKTIVSSITPIDQIKRVIQARYEVAYIFEDNLGGDEFEDDEENEQKIIQERERKIGGGLAEIKLTRIGAAAATTGSLSIDVQSPASAVESRPSSPGVALLSVTSDGQSLESPSLGSLISKRRPQLRLGLGPQNQRVAATSQRSPINGAGGAGGVKSSRNIFSDPIQVTALNSGKRRIATELLENKSKIPKFY